MQTQRPTEIHNSQPAANSMHTIPTMTPLKRPRPTESRCKVPTPQTTFEQTVIPSQIQSQVRSVSTANNKPASGHTTLKENSRYVIIELLFDPW